MRPFCLLPFGRLCVLPLFFLAAGCGSLFGADAGHRPVLRGTVRPQISAIPHTWLASGDRVRVLVSGEDDLSGEFVVDNDGFVRLPMVGLVEAAGLSTGALEDRIRRKLADGYLKNPQVHVTAAGHQAIFRGNAGPDAY